MSNICTALENNYIYNLINKGFVMKFLPLLVIYILFSLYSYSQCYEFNSEIQNVESSLSSTIKNLKKVDKTKTLEEAQSLVDKAIENIDEASQSCNMAESIASECECENGMQISKNIYSISSDLLILLKKTADSGELTILKKSTKKIIEIAENARSEASYSINACDE